MEPGQGELSALLLHPIGAGHGVHAQPTLDHQTLAHLHPVGEVLGEVAPAHHTDLASRIFRAQAIKAHQHLRQGSLVLLGVAKLGSLQHLHLEQAVIHAPTT